MASLDEAKAAVAFTATASPTRAVNNFIRDLGITSWMDDLGVTRPTTSGIKERI